MRLLLIAFIIGTTFAQQEEVKTVETRAISEPEQGGDQFKIYVGTIDGVRRELFNEVDGGQIEVAPDNTPNQADPFGAYDDNNVISTDNEKILFVPKPYRPGGDKKDTKKTTKTTTTIRTTRPPPPTTIRTIPFVQTTPSPATFATLPPVTRPPPIQTIQPFQPQTIATIQPSFNRPPPPTAPPRIIPQQPILPIQPQQPFQPQLPQQPFQPTFQQQRPTQPPFRPQTQPTFATRPPPPAPAPTTPAPRAPFGQNLRSGQCPASIFYISTPISGPSRLTFTHFAVAVTVDQCARTCHEFNCAIAHYNPLNGHCEFNPSTAFAIRNGQCPAWPSLHYRNNVVANEPVRIFCVTCQRPRRRPAGNAGRRPFRGQARRGQRVGRKTESSRVAKQRQLRATSVETEAAEVAPRTTERSSQLDLLKQLEDLQL